MNLMTGAFETLLFSFGVAIALLVVARKMNIPSVPLLLLAGLAFGREGLGLIDVATLGEFLRIFISFSVAVILFEGGLTLDYSGYKRMNKPIKRLLSIGVLVTWLSIAFFIYYVFSYSFAFSLLAGSLVIVTGPTVILPILRRINPQKNVNHILQWEGVLVDPIGVFIAIFCFEIFVSEVAAGALFQFLLQFVTGISFGVAFGFGAVFLLRRRIIPEDLTNIFILGVALLTYGLSQSLVHESGLLAVVLAGSIIGFRRPIPMEQVKRFKLELTQIFVGLIFILLSSSLELSNLALFGWKGFFLVLFVVFVARPLSVFLSTWGTGLATREKLFLSWVAPRGVIAASVAAIFGVSLRAEGLDNAWFIETFTFAIITVTVIVQGFSAGFAAKILRVQKTQLNGVLIIGIHLFSEGVARFLTKQAGRDVIFIDRNKRKVEELAKKGYNALQADSMDLSLLDDERFSDVGLLLALTDNEELNTLICQQWSGVIGEGNLYKWQSKLENDGPSRSGTLLWSDLPKPSILSKDILDLHTQLQVLQGTESSAKNKQLLMAFSSGELVVEPTKLSSLRKELKEVAKDKPFVGLYLHKKSTVIANLMHKDFVMYTSLRDYGAVVQEAVRRVKKKIPEIPEHKVLGHLLGNDKQYINLEEGIAMQHLFLGELKRTILMVVRVAKPIRVPGTKEEPIRLVFLILNSSNDPERYLGLMSGVANILLSAKTRAKLMEASSKKQVLESLKIT